MRYFVAVFSMIIFIIFYVGQSIEVMKIKLDYERLQQTEQSLIKENDILKSELETLRDPARVSEKALAQGYLPASRNDVVILKSAVKAEGVKQVNK